MRSTRSVMRSVISDSVSNCQGEEREYVIRLVRPFLRAGWTLVGSANGAFARVILLSADCRRIIKISGDWHDFTRAGRPFTYPDSFKRFAVWACRQSSPHLPKFYRVASLRKFGLFFCEMERLEKVDPYAVYDVIDGFRDIYDLPQEMQDVVTVVHASLQFKQHKGCDRDLPDRLSYSFGRIIRRLIDTLGYPNDLHASNIMLRNGSVPVILDPYADFPPPEMYEDYH